MYKKLTFVVNPYFHSCHPRRATARTLMQAAIGGTIGAARKGMWAWQKLALGACSAGYGCSAELIDRKRVPGLTLTDKSIHYSVLCEFCCRPIEDGAGALLVEQLPTLSKSCWLLNRCDNQLVGLTYIIAEVRQLSYVEVVTAT